MSLEKLEDSIGYIRFMSIIAVVASGFGSLLMFLVGALKVYRAYLSYFAHDPLAAAASLTGSNLAISYVVQAIDAFLIALVLMIFGGGVYNLFVFAVDESKHQSHKLFRISSIAELKRILAELVIVILMVKFLEGALGNDEAYRWELLIIPAGVLMLAASVRVLKLR